MKNNNVHIFLLGSLVLVFGLLLVERYNLTYPLLLIDIVLIVSLIRYETRKNQNESSFPLKDIKEKPIDSSGEAIKKEENLVDPSDTEESSLGPFLSKDDPPKEDNITDVNSHDFLEELFKPLVDIERKADRFEDKRSTITFAIEKITEIGETVGLIRIEEIDEGFDALIHEVFPVRYTKEGTRIKSLIRPGLKRGNKIILRALVEI